MKVILPLALRFALLASLLTSAPAAVRTWTGYDGGFYYGESYVMPDGYWNTDSSNKTWVAGKPENVHYTYPDYDGKDYFTDGDDVFFDFLPTYFYVYGGSEYLWEFGYTNLEWNLFIEGTVTPGSITVRDLDCTFLAGTNGKIAGTTTTLLVTDGATLTVALANTFGGGTTIEEDSQIIVQDEDALGTGMTTIASGGKLTADGVNFAGSITGNGATSYLSSENYGAFSGTLTGSFGVEEGDTLILSGFAEADGDFMFSLASLTNSGELTFNLTNEQDTMTAGTYWLISSYTATTGTLGWNESILDSNAYDWKWDTDGGALGLHIFAKTPSGGGGGAHGNPITWSGVGSKWNTDTANKAWISGSYDELDYFADGDDVIFNGAGNGTITLEGVVRPGTITVSGGNYTFVAGEDGEIAGEDTTLEVTGGTLTINLANTYGGGTVISGDDTIVTTGNAQAFGTGAIVYYGGLLNFNNQAVTNDLIIRSGEDAYISGYGSYTGTITMEGSFYYLDSDVAKFNTSASLVVGNDTLLVLAENWCEGFSLASLTVNGFLEFDMGDNTLTEGFYTLFPDFTQ